MRTNEERSRLIHKRTAEINGKSKTEYSGGLMRSA